jgi:hypothetical protein
VPCACVTRRSDVCCVLVLRCTGMCAVGLCYTAQRCVLCACVTLHSGMCCVLVLHCTAVCAVCLCYTAQRCVLCACVTLHSDVCCVLVLHCTALFAVCFVLNLLPYSPNVYSVSIQYVTERDETSECTGSDIQFACTTAMGRGMLLVGLKYSCFL